MPASVSRGTAVSMEKGELLDRTGPGFPIVSEMESHGLARRGASKQSSPAISSFAETSQYQTMNHEPETRKAYLGVWVPARRVSSLRHWTHFGQWPLSCHPDGRICLESPRPPQTKEQRYAMALEPGQQLCLPRNEDKENTSKDEVPGYSLSSLCVSLSRTCVLNKATRGRTVDGMQ